MQSNTLQKISEKTFFKPNLTSKIVEEKKLNHIQHNLYIKHKLAIKSLTERELEVFCLIANGYKSKQISDHFFIEVSTVASHRKSIIKKLGIEKSVDWFLIAFAFGMIDFF